MGLVKSQLRHRCIMEGFLYRWWEQGSLLKENAQDDSVPPSLLMINRTKIEQLPSPGDITNSPTPHSPIFLPLALLLAI